MILKNLPWVTVSLSLLACAFTMFLLAYYPSRNTMMLKDIEPRLDSMERKIDKIINALEDSQTVMPEEASELRAVD